ncbi:MAG TPA: histidine phosphatase family protein [Spirochaetia bacterium]|nr:histidine phosphatase family protein [Spirochaetia bacterium]
MKELLLYRHAKAEKSVPGGTDDERPLSPRGEHEAKTMGRKLKAADAIPDYILSSSATRAADTAAITSTACGCRAPVHYATALYDAEPESYAQELRRVDKSVNRVMLVGHNPTIEEFAARLLGHRIEMKTAYLVHLSLDISGWQDFELGAPVKLKSVLVPETAGV